MKVLILGSSSFAAHGLTELLRKTGHEVWTFNRSSPKRATARDLCGSYDQLAQVTAPIGPCDALINYAIVKHGTETENLRLTDQIIAAARSLGVARFIHISSISVLPALHGAVDEETPSVAHRWKGVYSRIKVAV